MFLLESGICVRLLGRVRELRYLSQIYVFGRRRRALISLQNFWRQSQLYLFPNIALLGNTDPTERLPASINVLALAVNMRLCKFEVGHVAAEIHRADRRGNGVSTRGAYTCRQRTARHEEDWCWPAFEKSQVVVLTKSRAAVAIARVVSLPMSRVRQPL